MRGFPWTLIIAGVAGAVCLVIARWAADTVIRKKVFGPAVRDLEQMLPRLHREIAQYRDLTRDQQAARSVRIIAMFTRANTDLRALDDLRRRRYELRISEMRGMAVSAGIQWTPPVVSAPQPSARRIA